MRRLSLVLVMLSCAETTPPPAAPAVPSTAAPAAATAATASAAQAASAAEVAAPPYHPPDEPWRKEQPRGGPPPEIKLPKAQVARLKNGLEVILVETHHVPVVSAHLVVFAGAERTGAKQAGLAALTASLLTEGTAQHDAIALADAIDAIGAELTSNADYDGANISLTTLTKHLDAALSLFAEVVVTPSFPEKELDRMRDQRLTMLLQERDNPAAMALLATG